MLFTFACFYFVFFSILWNNSAFLLPQEDSERARYSHQSSRHSYLVCVQIVWFSFSIMTFNAATTKLWGFWFIFWREQRMLLSLKYVQFWSQYFESHIVLKLIWDFISINVNKVACIFPSLHSNRIEFLLLTPPALFLFYIIYLQ